MVDRRGGGQHLDQLMALGEALHDQRDDGAGDGACEREGEQGGEGEPMALGAEAVLPGEMECRHARWVSLPLVRVIRVNARFYGTSGDCGQKHQSIRIAIDALPGAWLGKCAVGVLQPVKELRALNRAKPDDSLVVGYALKINGSVSPRIQQNDLATEFLTSESNRLCQVRIIGYDNGDIVLVIESIDQQVVRQIDIGPFLFFLDHAHRLDRIGIDGCIPVSY